MTEEDKNDKYISCSKCISKCTNDEEHTYKYFGDTRIEMRCNTCVRCRAKGELLITLIMINILKKKSIMKTIKTIGTNVINNTEGQMLIG